MKLLLRLGRGSRATQVSVPIMTSTMSLCSLPSIEVVWKGIKRCWTQPATGTSLIRLELDRALDRVGSTDEKRHGCTQFEVGQTDPGSILC
ncbi:unnamed protein product [Microthlaspi erraticum]|uniref:Uncharacterized protein n=1 Tax=Microthlaspi erraticum TaxID=1685480 RepID=A0A6D2IR47_9BRAS|nr:unnamed protein product [Microthlaspi erraticum]